MSDLVAQAQTILSALGLPKAQQNRISGLTLLSLARVSDSVPWSAATSPSLTIRIGIMDYMRDHLGQTYAENTRETVRRRVLHQFEQAGVVARNIDDPSRPTNSKDNNYTLTPEALAVCRAYGSPAFAAFAQAFVDQCGSLAERYAQARDIAKIPVTILGEVFELSPGAHNELGRAIVEDFAGYHAPGSILLYLGDTAKKAAHVDRTSLEALGFDFSEHDKLPDVVLYEPNMQWLFLVEAVTSHGPMDAKRVVELKDLFGNTRAGLVFVSAFPNRAEYRKHQADISWETEVWIAEEPTHLIHYNGDRFLGPHDGHA